MGAGRVAVVVAAGVGDQPRGDAAERIANGLRMEAGFEEPVQYAEWYEVPGVAIQPVDRFETGHGDTEVDVYEFWWADLSRFPAASRSFLAAFVGLVLALPSFGRTALRRTKEIGYDVRPLEGRSAGDVDYHVLGLLAWVVAVPVVVVSALLLVTVATLSVAVTVSEATISGAIAVGIAGVGATAVAMLVLRRYQAESGRRGVILLWWPALAAATALCCYRIAERGTARRGIELALADTVTALVAYPMRILWLAVLGLAAAMALVLSAKLATARIRDRDHVKPIVGKTVTAILTVGFGPFGFAALMAILSAAVGGIAQKVGPTVHWVGAKVDRTPWCLDSPDAWKLTHCPNLSAWQFGTLTLGNAIFALACAFVVVLVVLVLFVLVLAVGEAVHRIQARDCERNERKARVQAARITLALDAVGGLPGAVVLLVAALAGAYVAAAAWLPWWLPFDVKSHVGFETTVATASSVNSGWAPTVAAIVGATVSGLLIAARFAGITPQQLKADSAASNLLRLILDKPYDIATFLRDPVGSVERDGRHLVHLDEMPRQKILDRYRALLAFIVKRGYDHIVFAAHSQGTVLTVTLLHEPVTSLPPVSLVTFGCPLRQLYSERFPSQYAWVLEPDTVRDFVQPVRETWINLGTAGDPVGRTVFGPVPSAWPGETTDDRSRKPYLQDLALGAGGHSSYWASPQLYRTLGTLIDPLV